MDAASFLAATRGLIDEALESLLPAADEPPAELHRAMRYSVFAGGKRLRPALALAASRPGDRGERELAPACAALEMIHTYSLIHDDLPAMDDDRLRRGRPTCHVVFGEATAILAGDALLTLAFETLATHPRGSPGQDLATRRVEALRRVARAAGPLGMVGGQAADLAAERGPAPEDPSAALRFIHERKTGALIAASVVLGGILGGLEPPEVERLERFGAGIGLAFQIADDILDVEGTDAQLGKTAGKDARASKLTFPGLFGIEGSRREAARLIEQAQHDVEPLGEGGALLGTLARFVLERRS